MADIQENMSKDFRSWQALHQNIRYRLRPKGCRVALLDNGKESRTFDSWQDACAYGEKHGVTFCIGDVIAEQEV